MTLLTRLCILCIFSLLVACASVPQAKSARCEIDSLALPVDTPLPAAQLEAFATLDPYRCQLTAGQPYRAMVLSGGGADAAYGAGVISGLLKAGMLNPDNAPCYTTGVSAGAILAPYVYLATAQNAQVRQKYQQRLQQLFQQIDDDHLLALNLPWQILSDKSVYDAKRIYAEIARQLDADFIAAVAQEYQATGRKLYIGAVDIYRGQFEIIDLSRQFLLSATQPSQTACLVDSIRASAAIPLVFEPVLLHTPTQPKLLIDGGMRYPLFLYADFLQTLKQHDPSSHNAPVEVMIVVNHPGLSAPLAKTAPAIRDISFRSYMNSVGEITRNQRMTDAAFMVQHEMQQHHFVGLWANGQRAGQCVHNKNQSKLFDAQYQACLFEAGFSQAQSTKPFEDAPYLPAMHPQAATNQP